MKKRKSTMKTNLRRFRFDRGELSQQQLADMVLVSRQTIVAIERGDYHLPVWIYYFKTLNLAIHRS